MSDLGSILWKVTLDLVSSDPVAAAIIRLTSFYKYASYIV